ncbi:MAG: serine/threonine protein kinase [Candidatus Bathyarchaeota archaeon]|nr:serine/threonine protein kinase [Candidatus Bathyarchaeota archaeon]
MSVVVPIGELNAGLYASVVCYPRVTQEELEGRLAELRRFGVEALEFRGKSSAFTVPVLGKGYVGVVVVAHVCGERIALKMRRVDADRKSLEHEAGLLVRANAVNVGPRFLAVSKNFLLMQLVEGDLLLHWLAVHREKGLMRNVLADVLEQCWRLDEAGLDHGELSKAPKHLLVDGANKPFIVDFESASVERKVANVTGVCQFLFQGNSDAAKLIAETLGESSRSELVDALRDYKKARARKKFEALIEIALGRKSPS